MIFRSGGMVGVAQSVEHQVVALGAAGSSPVTHPIFFVIQAVENVQSCLSSTKTIILTTPVRSARPTGQAYIEYFED